jgi:hypothetical protein
MSVHKKASDDERGKMSIDEQIRGNLERYNEERRH